MPRYCRPELLRRRGHFLERVVPVARGGVAMKSAAQIFALDQARQAFLAAAASNSPQFSRSSGGT